MLMDWVMAAGAGSIFQGAQHEAGENSGVGPLPADINMVEPPSDWLSSPTACNTNKCHSDTVHDSIENSPNSRSYNVE